METKHWYVENKKIVYWTQRVFSELHEAYLTTTVHETFNDNEIKLVDSFVEDLLSKDDVSNVYVKEIKTISHTTFYEGRKNTRDFSREMNCDICFKQNMV